MSAKTRKSMTLSEAHQMFGTTRAVTVNSAGRTIIVQRNGMNRAYNYTTRRDTRLDAVYHGTPARLFFANFYMWTFIL